MTTPGVKPVVLGIGLSRTGTSSLAAALSLLGYTTVHFPNDNVTKEELTIHLKAPGARLRLSILQHVHALCDTPICCAYQALDAGYEGSRFVLTTREKTSWLASCERYWRDVLGPLEKTMLPHDREYVRLINRTTYGTDTYDPREFTAAYDRHNASVADYFRRRRRDLLVLNICRGEGWTSLCGFLDVQVPNVDFPHINAACQS